MLTLRARAGTVRRMEFVQQFLTWEWLAIAVGWAWAAWEWFSGRKDRREANARHQEMKAENKQLRRALAEPDPERRAAILGYHAAKGTVAEAEVRHEDN